MLPLWVTPWICVSSRKHRTGAWDKNTAIEEVMRNTPPSGFALNVGKASRSRCRFPFTFTAQHYHIQSEIQNLLAYRGHTLSHSSSDKASRSLNAENLVHPYRYINEGSKSSTGIGDLPTALEMMMSRPPKPLILSWITFLQSAKTPTSWVTNNRSIGRTSYNPISLTP